MRNAASAILVAAALALSAGNAAAVSYTFTNIADSSGPFSSFSTPTLNNDGTVVFAATLDTGQRGIFTGRGGLTTNLYDTSGSFDFFVGSPSINDNGTVAFLAQLDTGRRAIFTGSGGPTTTIAVSRGPFDFLSELLSLNNSGTVTFRTGLGVAGDHTIFTGNGGPTTTIADSHGPPFDAFLGPPSINDGGTVAFFARLDTGGPGIFTGSGGPTTALYPFGFGPSLNDSGTVAFSTGEAILTGNGGLTTTIADTSGPFLNFSYVSLNNNGTVAFQAQGDRAFDGIFTGPDPSADRVISSGDPLFGSRYFFVDRFFAMEEESLNDNGQIAFFYQLDDGRFGIARADPLATPIPEPGTLFLLAAGLLGAVLSGRRPRRGGVKPPSAA